MGVQSDDDIEVGDNAETVTLFSSPTTNAGQVSKRSSAISSSSKSQLDPSTRKVKRLRKKTADAGNSPIVKYGSLCLLVAQLVGLVMLMRYSRTHSDGDMYLSTTAVFCMEVSFIPFAFLLCSGLRSFVNVFREVARNIMLHLSTNALNLKCIHLLLL